MGKEANKENNYTPGFLLYVALMVTSPDYVIVCVCVQILILLKKQDSQTSAYPTVLIC